MIMSVRIGHASLNEHGKISGGKAGDQTGKEVCIRNWYRRDWSVMLRPKNADLAEKSAKACEAGCQNNLIGYSQANRNSLHACAQRVAYNLAKVNNYCETDCSAFMTICAIAGGARNLEYTTNAPTTSTMRKAFAKSGLYEVHTESMYLTSDKHLKRGDILVAEGKHTVMVLDNGNGNMVKSVTDIAREVLAGKWGSGQERKNRITSAGYDYSAVQAEVNRLLKQTQHPKP